MTAAGGSTEARITELEIRYAEQQRMLEELSTVVYDQQKTIDALTAELRDLKKKVPEPGLVDAQQHERPPHY
jgi:SlyX protein